MPRPSHQSLFDHHQTDADPASVIKAQIYTVSDAVALINDILSPLELTIEGEISGFKISQAKFAFFDIKDDSAVLNCFMMAHQLPFALEDGMKVRLTGLPKVRAASGRFGMTVKNLELVGEGALQKAFEALKQKLETEGLFEQKWKKHLPMFPINIGLITSKTGDALQDILRIMRNRAGGLNLHLAPVAVQGQNAVSEIASAIQFFNTHGVVDVIIIARGGGSLEDLQAYNAEPLARAIFASRLPVVTGVGHEPDVTLADLVADVRAATPTNAAEIVAPNFAELENNLTHHHSRLKSSMRTLLISSKHNIGAVLGRLTHALTRPQTIIQSASDRLYLCLQNKIHIAATHLNTLVNLNQQMSRSTIRQIDAAKANLDKCEALLTAFDPWRVLDRGYAIATRAGGSIIKSARDVKINDDVSIKLSRGSILTKVQKINDERT